jgi:hypothetical protein
LRKVRASHSRSGENQNSDIGHFLFEQYTKIEGPLGPQDRIANLKHSPSENLAKMEYYTMSAERNCN